MPGSCLENCEGKMPAGAALHYRARGEDSQGVVCKDTLSAVWILSKMPELKLSSWDHSHKRSAFGYQQHQQLPLMVLSKEDDSCLLPSAHCPFPVLSSREASNQRRKRSREGHPSLLLSHCGGPALMSRLGLERAEGFGLNGRLKL